MERFNRGLSSLRSDGRLDEFTKASLAQQYEMHD
jgi:hypothetical protein